VSPSGGANGAQHGTHRVVTFGWLV